VTTSAGGEAVSGREKGEDDASSVDVNLTGSKNEKNSHGRFNYYKWMVKI
jgi:hypothetical protein